MCNDGHVGWFISIDDQSDRTKNLNEIIGRNYEHAPAGPHEAGSLPFREPTRPVGAHEAGSLPSRETTRPRGPRGG